MKVLSRSMHFVPMILIMGTIFFLSHQPGEELPLPAIYGFDKLAHGFVYAALAAATLHALSKEIFPLRPFQTGLMVILFCLAYGLTDEYHQTFIPGREASFGDLLADTLGAAVFVYIWFRCIRLRPLKNCTSEDGNPGFMS